MFGSHLSIAGSMVNALDEGASLGLDTVQVFTKNQQQWNAKPLDPGMVRDWRARVAALGWDHGCDDDRGGLSRGRIVSHASYLINLASVNPELWRKSVDLMTDEIERCEALGIPFLVHHPGSFVGADLGTGIANIARAYAELARRTPGYGTLLCLEGTAGAGSQIGGPFEHLSALRAAIVSAGFDSARVGYCLDTCHLHAAGHDLRTRRSAGEVLERFDALCGLEHLRVLHVNDSKGALGSKLDRHAQIGEGEIALDPAPEVLGQSGFAVFLNHPRLARIPKVLETPKGLGKGRVPFDTVNLNRLRALVGLAPVKAPADPGPTSLSASKERARTTPRATGKPKARPTKSRPPPRKKNGGKAGGKGSRD
jgi:deoxyribonuclease-4